MTDKPKQMMIISPVFRLSFCSLFQPKPDMNGYVRYQMEMLFPKDRGGAQFTEMLNLYNHTLANAKFSAGGPTPRTFKQAIIDGSTKKQDGRHGMFMLKAGSGVDFPPRLILQDGRPAKNETSPEGIYEGCWCRATLTGYTYEAKHKDRPNVIINRGAAYNVKTVQKVNDDEPFSKGISIAEEDELLAANPIAQTAAPVDDELGDLM